MLVLLWNLWAQGPDASARDLLAASCESCHPSEVAQWQQSRHAVAFSNGLFRAELVAMQGVGCMSCHMGQDGHLVSRNRAPNSPHKTLVSEEFGSAGFCAGCHEFKFPVMGDDGMPVAFQDLAMQTTASEFAETSAASNGDDCRSCHMVPSVGAHRFVGSHDLPTLQSALEWDVCLLGDELRVEIANIGAAHAVPTGGVNRHIVLRMWQSESPDDLVEHFIGRKFEGDDEGEKTLVVNSSLAAGESRIFSARRKSMAPRAGAPINVELRYIYPLDEFAELAPGTRRFATVFRERKRASEFEMCGER